MKVVIDLEVTDPLKPGVSRMGFTLKKGGTINDAVDMVRKLAAGRRIVAVNGVKVKDPDASGPIVMEG